MKIIKNIDKAKTFTNQSTVAIGNFDGVHLGHKKIIFRASQLAESNKFGVITFEPHPRDYFLNDSKPFKLTRTKEKYNMLKELDLDFVVELNFNKQLEKYSPEQFVSKILNKSLGVKNVIVGQDFRFGYKRSGNFTNLKDLSKSYEINAYAIGLKSNSKKTISSTHIRTALVNGKIKEAKDMLGYWHKIYGKVVRGEQRGHELGFPTVNLEFKKTLIPRFGVYTCFIEILSKKFNKIYKGVASIGKRPTFGENQVNLEAHIFDFNHQIYGEEIVVSLIEFQRPEEKFNTIEQLIKQMHVDCELAKKYIASLRLKE